MKFKQKSENNQHYCEIQEEITKRSHKLLSLILSFCIAMSMLTGFATVSAVANPTAIGNEIFELPDIIDSGEVKENNYVGRV